MIYRVEYNTVNALTMQTRIHDKNDRQARILDSNEFTLKGYSTVIQSKIQDSIL